MNDYQEYRSYGSYLGRIFALIIGVVLLILAIWFVVRLADGDDSDSSLGESSGSSLIDENIASDEQNDENNEDPQVSGANDDSNDSDESNSGGEVSSINTDNDTRNGSTGSVAADGSLPETGAEIWMILVVPAVVFATTKLALREN